MYKSHVVAGRIIEIQDNRILTQQGDTFCTYHTRYYMLPPKDMETEVKVEAKEQTEPGHKWKWNSIRPWFTPQKKSANRI